MTPVLTVIGTAPMVVLAVIGAPTVVAAVITVRPVPFSGRWLGVIIGVPGIPRAWVHRVGLVVVVSVVLVPTIHVRSGNEKSGKLTSDVAGVCDSGIA